MAKHYVGEAGVDIVVETNYDISQASTKQCKVRKPSGQEVTWTAVTGPVDQYGNYTKLQYTTASGDVDEAGYYTLQAYVVISTLQKFGDAVKFKIEAGFS